MDRARNGRGLPIEHYLSRFEKLALRGALQLGIAGLAFVGLQRMARELDMPARWCPARCNNVFGAAIDASIAACAVAGTAAIARLVLRTHSNGWIDVAAVLLAAVCALGLKNGRRAFQSRFAL